jgi:hypothetical protein
VDTAHCTVNTFIHNIQSHLIVPFLHGRILLEAPFSRGPLKKPKEQYLGSLNKTKEDQRLFQVGDNDVYLNFTDRFRLLNPHVNIAYLRPYRLRTPDIGSPPARLSVKPVSVESDGSTWYEIEEILDHRGSATNTGECLVRWKDFDGSHDSCIPCHSVTPLTLRTYEEFLIAHAQEAKCLAARTNRKSDVTRADTASSSVVTESETSDVPQNAPSVEIEVVPVVSSTGL